MPDGKTWWLAEIYEVRHSKYFEESDEDEEDSETYHEEFIENLDERDEDGNPMLYKELYEMHDMSIMHSSWQ